MVNCISIDHTQQKCTWCNPIRNKEILFSLPNCFCWTKMQTEAGEELSRIIHRKELERTAGNGLFFWGIGNAIEPSITRLIQLVSLPEVLFSVMLSKPKKNDVSPDSVVCWTAYQELSGKVSLLPPHSLVISRGNTTTSLKKNHYALVCRSDNTLLLESIGHLDFQHCFNLLSDKPLGFSQVTAIVKHKKSFNSGPYYDINMRAILVPPYFVRLLDPLPINFDSLSSLRNIVDSNPNHISWKAFIKKLQNQS